MRRLALVGAAVAALTGCQASVTVDSHTTPQRTPTDAQTSRSLHRPGSGFFGHAPSSHSDRMGTTSATGACRLRGHGITATPNRRCTPGEWIGDPDTSVAHVCAKPYNPRPSTSVSAALKRQALAEYGMGPQDADVVEGDHYFPVWLGGATTLANFWPEPNYPPTEQQPFTLNPKDRLEFTLYRMVCQRHVLTVMQARALFQSRLRWTTLYRRYVGPLS